MAIENNYQVDKNKKGKRAPLFRTTNYILMGVGVLLLFIGYICLSGGKVPDEVFDGEIFNTRRIVVAPVLIFLGLVTEVVAIMWHPRVKNNKSGE
ncbi:MAG: DUF3098 domain-containing protein [Bacteroidales bacterium]|nr:DUF3098 domain-containing protein [Bacteroidales bacterium]MDY6348557.1 DUF3098 domain-containing protein [Bacteroidales bacterium]